METRKCKECNKAISGRVDKVFCNETCKNSYNNKRITSDLKLVRQINMRLMKNRSTLKRLLADTPKGSCIVTGTTLRDANFNFQHFTGINKTKSGKTYYYCYEYGYSVLENDSYLIVKNTN